MPLDQNGDKWACESCVRGHRSSRCEHYKRVMVKVKKPGRPLQQCTHPNKELCVCNKERVLVVRIKNDGSGCSNRVAITHIVQPNGQTIKLGELPPHRPLAHPPHFFGTPYGTPPSMAHPAPQVFYGPAPMPHMMDHLPMPPASQMPHFPYEPHMQPVPPMGYHVEHQSFVMPQYHINPMMARPVHAYQPMPFSPDGVQLGPQADMCHTQNSAPASSQTIPQEPLPEHPESCVRNSSEESHMGSVLEAAGDDSFSPSTDTVNIEHTSGSSESCTCGDGCTCFGCSSHPINPGAASRMHELAEIMELEGIESSSDFDFSTQRQTPPLSPTLPSQYLSFSQPQESHMAAVSHPEATYVVYMKGCLDLGLGPTEDGLDLDPTKNDFDFPELEF